MDEDVELRKIRTERKKDLLGYAKGNEKKSPNATVTIDDSNFNNMIHQYPLMLIDCWAPWCAPCRMMAPVIEKMAKSYVSRVVFGKLNVDENPNTSRQFQILAIPTLLIIKNAKEVDRIVGAAPRQLIETKLRKYL